MLKKIIIKNKFLTKKFNFKKSRKFSSGTRKFFKTATQTTTYQEGKSKLLESKIESAKFLKCPTSKAVKLKQEKPLKFHVIARESLAANMENYWEQANGHAQPPHPVKFER